MHRKYTESDKQPFAVSTFFNTFLKKNPTYGVYQNGIFFNSKAMYINTQLNIVSILTSSLELISLKKINNTTTSSDNL